MASFELTVQGIAVLIVGATEAVPLRRHAAIRIEVGVTALDADPQRLVRGVKHLHVEGIRLIQAVLCGRYGGQGEEWTGRIQADYLLDFTAQKGAAETGHMSSQTVAHQRHLFAAEGRPSYLQQFDDKSNGQAHIIDGHCGCFVVGLRQIRPIHHAEAIVRPEVQPGCNEGGEWC